MAEHYFERLKLEIILSRCINRTLGEVDYNNVFEKTINKPKITGIAGDVIEQSVLGYPADNKQEPDLNVGGIPTELKTTGIKKSKKKKVKYEAKEPMSITAVRPEHIVFEKFKDSNFWHKLEHLLFVYYLYDSDYTVKASEYANFPIMGYQFYEFNSEDRKALKNDWKIVRDFIVYLQAEYPDNPEEQYYRLSSELRDKLLMIDTAPKWPNRPRFRLKRSVVTAIVQEYFGNRLDCLPKAYKSYADIDEQCNLISKKYGGYSVNQLISEFGIEPKKELKSIAEPIIVHMFGGNVKKLNKISIFNKAGLLGKSIVLTKAGSRTEDTKLFNIDFDEILNPNVEFQNSSFYDYFNNHQILFIVFEEPSNKASLGENRFVGFKRLSFDEHFIDNEVRVVWNKIRELIFNNELEDIIERKKNGEAIINKTGVVSSAPNFPKSKEYTVFVRGSGEDSTKKTLIINDISMYEQWIWIKGKYLAEKLAEIPFE